MPRCPRLGKSNVTKSEDCEYHISSELQARIPRDWGEGGDTVSEKSIKVLTIDEAGFKHLLNQRTSIPGH